MSQNQVILLTTGGTFDKSYNEWDGSLANRETMVRERLLSRLRLPYTDVQIHSIMAKDSLEMTDLDRELIGQKIEDFQGMECPIVILHGTDTMEVTARYCHENVKTDVPVIFTGAMKPLGYEDSDATQNFVEALYICQHLEAGFYVSFHNRLFKVPNVRKNRERLTFEDC